MLNMFALIVPGVGGMRYESQACLVWDIRDEERKRVDCHSSDSELTATMKYLTQTLSQMFAKKTN